MSIQELFEAFVKESLTAAIEHVDASDEVSDIWIYNQLEGEPMCRPLYRVNGQICGPGEVDEQVREPVEGSVIDLYMALSGANEQLNGGIDAILKGRKKAPKSPRPTRLIIHYDTAQQAMDSEFSYEPLGAPGEDIWDSTIFEQWRDHLKATGEFPADRVTGPADPYAAQASAEPVQEQSDAQGSKAGRWSRSLRK